jgi:hypothetical protein
VDKVDEKLELIAVALVPGWIAATVHLMASSGA